MRFDPNVITHLGIQMYSTLPPVIAELVSNSYDAESEEVNIFLNVATITALQAIGLVEFYLGSNLYGGTSSTLFSCTNTNFDTIPKGLIKYWEPAIIPNHATSIFTRYITNPGTEIVDGGQIILAPGKSFYIYISDSNHPLTYLSTRLAFGWWEERRECCNSKCC